MNRIRHACIYYFILVYLWLIVLGHAKLGQPRPPFDVLIQRLSSLSGIDNRFKRKLAIVSVDVPSGWHVEEGEINGEGIKSDMLVSTGYEILIMDRSISLVFIFA